jgi:hypothetical protein
VTLNKNTRGKIGFIVGIPASAAVFSPENVSFCVELVAPKVPGTYALASSGSPIGLTIRVTGAAGGTHI